VPGVATAQEQNRLAPGVVTQFLFQRAVGIGHMGDTAEIITANVVKAGRKAKLV